MRLGIGSYTYSWAVGVSGYPSPPQPLTHSQLLDRAVRLGVRVVQFAEKVAAIGVDEIALADTVGFGNPNAIRALFTRVRKAIGPRIVHAAHFHDTRGLGIANVAAAIDVGVRHFDASLCGLGGCPFAPGATGNIVTEDVVFLAESLGFTTGIDLDKLVAVRKIVQEALPNEALYGQVAKAGLPKGFSYAASRKAA